MAHRFISEIAPGEVIDDIYLVKEPILRSTSRGDLYIAMFLCDKTGQLNGRVWQASEANVWGIAQAGVCADKGQERGISEFAAGGCE